MIKKLNKLFKKHTKGKKKNKFAVFVLVLVLFIGLSNGLSILFDDVPPLIDPPGTDTPDIDVERDGDGGGLPDEAPADDYLWYQVMYEFVMVEEPIAPLDPLGFTPAVDPDVGAFATEFFVDIYAVYWYGGIDDTFTVPFNGTPGYSLFDYPIDTADTLNENYSIWTAGDAWSGDAWVDYHSFGFATELPEWTGEPLITIYDGGMFVNKVYQIPVWYWGSYTIDDEPIEVGYIQISWILDGTGNHYVHPWM